MSSQSSDTNGLLPLANSTASVTHTRHARSRSNATVVVGTTSSVSSVPSRQMPHDKVDLSSKAAAALPEV